MALYKRGRVWWYKFTWNGEPIRESTKQTNKRVAEQIEAGHKTSLAKGEVGIRDRVPTATLREFAERDFTPFVEARFQDKPNTLEYYKTGVKCLIEYSLLANCQLDTITSEKTAGYIAKLRHRYSSVATINRRLEVLRRILKLAMEWGRVERVLPKIEMLPGENHRDRVLSACEEEQYLKAATTIGEGLLDAYRRALAGIRATMRAQQPIQPDDPFLLRDVATVLSDCGLRPDECFRLRWEHIREGAVHVPRGKTKNARRVIPLTKRATLLLEMRREAASGEWVFPAATRSGHMEKSTLKKKHAKACKLAGVAFFTFYTFRHTCITRWAAFMDPYTLAYLAGHSDFATTRRYVHPEVHTIVAAIERAREVQGGHKTEHKDETALESPKHSIAAVQ
ncbi:MAG TPA: site-specific integrase [Bryobacteraceae bacterium]|nr:site-specific integrase [Bryobacteraceae bacterium]